MTNFNLNFKTITQPLCICHLALREWLTPFNKISLQRINGTFVSYYDVSFMFRNLSAYLSLHHKIPLISHLGNKPIHVHHLFGFHLFYQRIDGDEATCSSNAGAVKKQSVMSHILATDRRLKSVQLKFEL